MLGRLFPATDRSLPRGPACGFGPAASMSGVFIIRAAATDFVGSDRVRAGGQSSAAAAAGAALDGLDLARRRVGGVFLALPAGDRADDGEALLQQLGLRQLRIGAAPGRGAGVLVTVSSDALHLGVQALERGVHDLALCVAVDELHPSGNSTWPDTQAVRPHAAEAARYMWDSGATPRHLAKVTAKNRRHGALNPHVGRAGVEPETVLRSEMIAWPLRRLMVAPRGNGAAAVLLASPQARRRIGGRALRVRASVVAREEELNDRRTARLAYHAAQLGPEDVDCAEVHDVTAAAELAAYEALQFVPGLEGPELIDSGFTSLGGVRPVNTSGGMLSLGVSAAIEGAQLCEIVAQLRGDAGPRQVAGARVGLVHSRSGRPENGRLTRVTIVSW
jgi:acetyl-CoA acetyltransferase